MKYLFFDFGGCIDAPGIHSRTLFWRAFQRFQLLEEKRKTDFQEAYTQADRQMMQTGEAVKMNLRAFNRHNAALIARALGLEPQATVSASDAITQEMTAYLEHSRTVLQELGRTYPLGIISNFTGNLELILEEHGLRPLFHSVTESFYAQSSKPERKIFQLALAKQAHAPAECLYVGDNPVNDIAPAKALGMQAFLIHEKGAKRECGADAYLDDLAALPILIQTK